MSFGNLRLSGTSIASFLDNTTSVTTFELFNCDTEASERDQGVRELSSAFQRNTNIRKLMLECLDDIYMLPIFGSLQTNSHVKELVLRMSNPSIAASVAVRRLLESTMEGFELKYSAYNEETFRQIAQGLINSKSVTDIMFDSCDFHDKGSTLLFKSILQSNSNLHSLCINDSHFHGGPPSAALFTNLLQQDSALRSFKLSDVNLHNHGFTTREEFDALMRVVEKSKLEHLSIGRIVTQDQFRALIASIPNMQVRALEFDLEEDLEHLKPDLIRAVKKNATLRTVVGQMSVDDNEYEDLFHEDDKRKLKYYSARNEGFSQWIASPATLPRGAWLQALKTAQEIGPDTVFLIFQAIGTLVGPVEGKICRKRPRFYSPSG